MPIKYGITSTYVQCGTIWCFYTYYWHLDCDIETHRAAMQVNLKVKPTILNLN